jgi:putative ABC transport system permease protein
MRNWLDSLIQDVRFGLRSSFREIGFLIVVVLTLALGIGANTAIFSVAYAVLLRPLPYPHPERLGMVWNQEKTGEPAVTSYATFSDWKANVHSIQSMAAISYWVPTISGAGEPAVLEGSSVSADFFSVLGVGLMMGRDFLPQEDRPEHNKVVILSYKLWKNRFNSDPSIIGKPILLNGRQWTVVGVLRPDFQPLINFNFKETEIWRPLGYDLSLPYACRDCNHLRVVARIADGVTMDQARQDLDGFTKILIARYPKDYGIGGASIIPLQEAFVGKVRPVLFVLLGAVALVLLIACANVANLMLTRGTRRGGEMAVRRAMGATQSRLLRQLLTENLILMIVGGLLGLILSSWATDFLIAQAPQEIPRWQSISLNSGVLLFALAIILFSGLLFGMAPAWQTSKLDLQESLQGASRSTSSNTTSRLRKAFVVFNIAMALVLLMGAGLLLQTVRQLLEQQLGFTPQRVITMNLSVSGPRYLDEANVRSFFRQVLERVQSISGVQNAGIVSMLPLTKTMDMYGVQIKDKPLPNPSDEPAAERYAISSDYLNALQIAIIRGRGFDSHDHADSMPVVLVNRRFADKTWPGEDPIGKQIHIGGPELPWRTVVGVVENVRHQGLQEPFAMQFYLPYEQWSDLMMTLAIRTTADPAAVAQASRNAVWSVDQNQPVTDVATMDQVVSASIGPQKFVLQLIELFAVAALFLAAVGVYGVMAYTTARRIPEIGIRMALGADRRKIIALLLDDGVRMSLLGIAMGIAGALMLTRYLRSLLFHVSPDNPVILFCVSALILAVACLACFLPAFRASRLNPVLALRHE